MPEKRIHHPHDKLLKDTFSSPQNASAFFQHHLPSPLSATFDWSTLHLEPCSFIDPDFAASESDLLFRVGMERCEAFVYLLFEHQSSEDPRIALRLLSYILQIWNRFAKEHPAPVKLPPVLPLVLAQGKSPWKTPPRLEALIELPESVAEILRPWQPALAYHLLELVRVPYPDLGGAPEGILTLRVLKAQPVGQLFTDVIWDENLLFSISDAALERMIRYILHAEPDMNRMRDYVSNLRSKPLQNKAMSIAEQLREEGLQKGLRQGREEGLREAIVQALEIHYGACPSRITEVLEGIRDFSRLRTLLDSALRCPSLEEFSKIL